MDIEKQNKLNDIKNVDFGDNPQEIVSSLEILLMLFEVNDDKDVLLACKKRLQEGVSLLKKMNHKDADNFNI